MATETHSPNPADPAGHGISPAGSPENESLPVGTIALVAIVACTCFALAILWATQIMHGVERENEEAHGPWVKASEIGKPEVGIVDQTLYSVEHRAHDFNEEKLQKLNSYGWVSRKDGLIQIPITEAMKAVAAGKRPPMPAAVEPPPMPAEGAEGVTGPTGATGAEGAQGQGTTGFMPANSTTVVPAKGAGAAQGPSGTK